LVASDILTQLSDSVSSQQVIAVDATSSLGGIKLDLEKADIWFASVQKCLGLPSGMAVMFLSPKAVERVREVNDSAHYNSLKLVLKNSEKNQTHHTPNILDIYLLYRTQHFSSGINKIHEKILKRYENWIQLIDDFNDFDWLIKDPKLRSPTVMCISHAHTEDVKSRALNANIVLGNGYGDWASNTIRIANFPAIKGKEIEKLIKFFRNNID
jgi:phosphoserine aminotransferase